ncbi:transposase [Synechococcus sp. Cruz CV-v-12]|nr:transposase [Synechococcus sp. Cruz CV-v-12]
MGYTLERKSNAGRKRIDPLLFFKMLELQQLFTLSDEELEFQSNDRRSFEEFVGLGVMNNIPDSTPVNFFRKSLYKTVVIEELCEKFEACLRENGLEARAGQIIDATWVPIPTPKASAKQCQHNSREENKEFKAGC